MSRRIEKEYTDQWGQRIKDVLEPESYGTGYFHYRLVNRDGIWRQIGPMVLKSRDLILSGDDEVMIHDDKTNKNFGLAVSCPHCEKGWHSAAQGVENCRKRIETERNIVTAEAAAIATDKLIEALGGAIQSGGSNSTHFSVPSDVTDSDHIWGYGGSGGTGKCEVIPYRNGGYNTTTQIVEGTRITTAPMRTPLSPYDHPPKLNLKDGATYTGETRYNAFVSTGCPTCDYNLINQNVSTQRAYERWYDHYIEAQQWRGDGFIITHLEFIMREMMSLVTEETKLPALPGKAPKETVLIPNDRPGKVFPRRSMMFKINIGYGLFITVVCFAMSMGAEAITASEVWNAMPFVFAVIVASVLGIGAGTAAFFYSEYKDKRKYH